MTGHRLFAGASVLVLCAAAHAQIAFHPPVHHPTYERPGGIVAADFNGNGDIDLAVTVSSPNRVLVFFSNGDGTFGSPVSYSVGSGAGALAAGDLNGNGHVDLAVSLQNSAQVQLLINSGAGTFGHGPMLPVGNNPRGLRVIDLSGDGRLDLVVANRDSDSVTVLLNGGMLNFTPASYPVGEEPRDVAAGDITGNSAPDLVVTNHRDRNISVLHNNGSGIFSVAQTLSVGGNVRPAGVVAGDFDGSGRVDFAVATSGGGGHFAAIFRNTSGVLSGPFNFPVGAIDPDEIIAADLDGNGQLDLVTANEGTGSISVLANSGGLFTLVQTYATGAYASKLTVGDFDGNGSPDIAVSNRDADTISILLNQAGGPQPCYADCDGNEILNIDDFMCFINDYSLQTPYADCDGNGLYNIDDFMCFINLYSQGCP